MKPDFMKEAAKKIKNLREIVALSKNARQKGLRIVTTNGCFDILHVGHVRYLEKARNLGDLLIVGVNSDSSVKVNKGKDRPIVPEDERAEMIAALDAVDWVFIFKDKTPERWLTKINPDIHVKGGDRTYRQIVEREILKKIGARLVLVPPVKNKSTTNIIGRIKKLYTKNPLA